ncbi:hypothetical protein MJD09_04155 [bacterium]|nr:hypothetical protein [bacterium]
MKFNIAIAQSPFDKERVHSGCFMEVAHVLKFGLEDLGHEVDFGNGFQKDRLNFVLGYHNFNGDPLPKGYRYIIYQLEELTEQNEWCRSIINTLKSDSCVVWDFSQENIDLLARKGIKAVLKPIGFHPKMHILRNRKHKDVDILFYGSKNERRLKILRELNKKFRLKVLFGVYGEERNQWISRSKIILSIYFYKSKLFDDVRISFLVNNKAFSIIEDSPHRKYADFLTYVRYDRLVEQCAFHLDHDRLRNEAAEKAFTEFSRYPEIEFLKQALAQTL